MRTVYKYPLLPRQTIQLPVGAYVVSASVQRGQLCIWAVVDTDQPTITTPFYVIGTGDPLPEGQLASFVATVVDGPFVWHIFRGF